MDFASQQSLLSDLLGDANTSTDDAFPLARRKDAINRGDINFTKDSLCCKEYATGTVASLELSVPADYLKTHILIIDDDIVDNKYLVSLADWKRYKDTSEKYYFFWEFSGTKKFKWFTNSGVNGKTYYLYYFRKHTTDLSADADESIIPDEYREAPVFYAAWRLLKSIGKNIQAAEMKQEYSILVAQAMAQFGTEYIEKNYPNPDTGDKADVPSSVDHQGQGNLW